MNLKAFDSRFFNTCCKRFESVMMLRSRFADMFTSNCRRRLSASWRKGPRDHFQQVREVHFLRVDGNRARLDFRQIENVADQIEQIRAGAVDGAREFDLLVAEIPSGFSVNC